MPELPTTFGKYYLTEKLATGGMAEIYLAKLIGPGGFEKQLVLKQIHPKLSGQQQFVDMFVAEAKTLVTLTHGNIVPVYELGVVDDTYFIAMEYVDGPTLYRLTERMASRGDRMAPEAAAWIAARVLEGLDYAHRKGEGVIHRDLSPRNVMLSRDGDVKLVDFGIAVTLGEPGEKGARATAPTGSFPYMSPEQIRRDALTGQSDLFSVGILLWEMLVGERLFARPDPEATLDAVMNAKIPRPSEKRAEVPAKLDEVVMRALERDRAARWPSAGEMVAALQKFLYALDQVPGPQEVAALVAGYCPPETRRMPTHAEPMHATEAPAGGPSTAIIPRAGAAAPSTAVVPRDGAARGRPQRAQTFATHVEIEHLLETPADAPQVMTGGVPLSPEEAAQRPGALAPRRTPGSAPGRGMLVVAGLGALALAVGSVWMFVRDRDRVENGGEDAGAVHDAIDHSRPPPADAPALPDAALVVDAGSATPLLAPLDAGARVHADATVHPTLDATPLAAAPDAALATATLRIGADPWGEIFVDGIAKGTTPKVLPVTAGHHTVEVTYPAESPPRKQTFAVDVAAGEAKQIQADFK